MSYRILSTELSDHEYTHTNALLDVTLLSSRGSAQKLMGIALVAFFII